MMGFVLRIAVLAGLAAAALTPASAAQTCSQRHTACLKFCQTNYKNAPGCTSQCGDALPQCMSSGCWRTTMTNQCGFTKS